MSRPDALPRKLKADSQALATASTRQRRQQAHQLSMVHRDAARWEKRIQAAGGAGMEGEGQDAGVMQVSVGQVLAAMNLVRDALEQWQSGERENATTAVRALRQCVGAQGADFALQGGAVALLGKALELTQHEAPEVAEEAVWGMNNLMVSTSIAAKAVLNYAPLLMAGLSSSDAGLSGQCALALGNMAMEAAEYRDALLSSGAALAVGRQVARLGAGLVADDPQTSPPPASLSMHSRTLCNCLWSLTQLLRSAPQHMEPLITEANLAPSLLSLISSSGEQWVEEVAWVLVYLSAGPASVCAALQAQHAAEAVVEQLRRLGDRGQTEEGRWAQQLVPLLRCAGNLICEMSSQGDKSLYSQHLLPLLIPCLQAKHRGVRKEAARLCSFLPYSSPASNVPAPQASMQNPESVIQSHASLQTDANSLQAHLHAQSQVLMLLLGLLLKANFDLRKEAAFAIVAWCGYEVEHPHQSGGAAGRKLLLQQLLEQQPEVLHAFLQHLRHSDVEANRLGLEFTQLVLSQVPGGPQLVEAADGIDALEQIQYHCPREELATWAGTLVDTYFGENYGLEDNGAPEPTTWTGGPVLGF